VLGIPAVFGEVADGVEESYRRILSLDRPAAPGALDGVEVYHFYPSPEQVREWMAQAWLEIIEEGVGSGYRHILAKRNIKYQE
jgi:hypothetical protein